MANKINLDELQKVDGGAYPEYIAYITFLSENGYTEMTPEILEYADKLRHMHVGSPQPPGCPTPGFDLHDYFGSV